jgi:hypothetical protein
MNSEVVDAPTAWTPAVGSAVQSVVVEPLGGGAQVTLRLAGPVDPLLADVVEQHMRPRVQAMFERGPKRAQELAAAVEHAQESLASMLVLLRQEELASEMLLDSGKSLEAETPLAKAIDLRHKIQVKREAIKALRSRALEAIKVARRDVSHLTALARAEILEEMAAEAASAMGELTLAITGPLERLVAARVAWAQVAGSIEGAVDRLSLDLVSELPPAPVEERHVAVPVELQPRYGHFDQALGMFREGDPARPVLEPVGPVSEAAKARIAAQLAYKSERGWTDGQDRWHSGEPPPAGTPAPPLTPAFGNVTIQEQARQAQQQADEEARALAAQWVSEFDEAKRQAETLPTAPELPVAPQLPTAPTVLPPSPLPGVNDPPGPPRRNRRG